MQIINATRSPGYGGTRYAQLWQHNGQTVLVMGNSVQERADGTPVLWCALWASGERIDIPVAELVPYEGVRPTLLEVVDRAEKWAREGNDDAMWWLGDFYEHGSRWLGANGGKALAYYLAALRRKPSVYDKDTVSRVLHDGADLFQAWHPDEVEDKTPDDADAFLANFGEYRYFASAGRVVFPVSNDWKACISIAEALA